MSKPRYLIYDTVDDRREVQRLLERLSVRQRITFLAWCCQQVTIPGGTHPEVSRARTKGTAVEVYRDLWYLAGQYDLDIDAATEKLVEMVRQKDRFLRDAKPLLVSRPLAGV